MKEFTAIYSTKAIKNIQHSFDAENAEAAVEYASSCFAAFPELIIVENFEGSKANEGIIVWANGEFVEEQDQDTCNYIDMHNDTGEPYFASCKGETVRIVCKETGEIVYEAVVR